MHLLYSRHVLLYIWLIIWDRSIIHERGGDGFRWLCLIPYQDKPFFNETFLLIDLVRQ
jgi:hypothetical protein